MHMPVTAILAQYICDRKRLLYEPLHDKINETIYVPGKDSDQNEHPHRLISHSFAFNYQSFLYDSSQIALI